MRRYFTLILLYVLGLNFSLAQESYTEHTIQKGENVYQISRQYGVSVNAIFNLNPGSEAIIYAGSILRIPKSEHTTNTANTVINNNSISNYIVKRGETKSGLSRRFGVSIALLEQQNPHIINMLQADHIINIDKSVSEIPRTAKKGEHYVVKGETLWGIARNNGITLAQLETANSGRLSEFLQIGQTLVIPDKTLEVFGEGEYIVQRGDTKFQLAQRFNMTITQLEEKNPHIVTMLMAGHTINVDQDRANESEDNLDLDESRITEMDVDSTTTTDDYYTYTIQPKETLFGLAKKAGMTTEAFTTLNPKLRASVNAGDTIKMPTHVSHPTTEITEVSETVDATDSIASASPTTTNVTSNTVKYNNDNLIKNLSTATSNGLYFYTPFSGEELSSPELRKKMIAINEDFQKYVDFFQGAQIAIDSAKAHNLNFDVTLIKKNIAKPTITIDSPHDQNVILVPFADSGFNFPNIESTTPLSIVDIASNILTKDNINIYKAIPSDGYQKIKTLHYLAKQNANTIVISELDEAKDKNLIEGSLPNAKFLKVDNAGFINSEILDNALDKNKLNFIVLDSDKTIVFLNTTTALMRKLSDHNIQLVMLESALLPKQAEVSDMRFRILKLLYPTNTNPQNDSDIIHFAAKYEDEFSSKPSQEAIYGFNVTFDILLRISQTSSLEDSINTTISEQPHLKFDYQKTTDRIYSNTGIYLMQYNSDAGMEVLD